MIANNCITETGYRNTSVSVLDDSVGTPTNAGAIIGQTMKEYDQKKVKLAARFKRLRGWSPDREHPLMDPKYLERLMTGRASRLGPVPVKYGLSTFKEKGEEQCHQDIGNFQNQEDASND